MPEILKDRNYYRMLSSDELRDEAIRTSNELAFVLCERSRGVGYYRELRRGNAR